METKYYLIEGMTRMVATSIVLPVDEDNRLLYLQSLRKLSVHTDLEQELTEAGYKDGDEVPISLFIPAAVPASMQDKFTEITHLNTYTQWQRNTEKRTD